MNSDSQSDPQQKPDKPGFFSIQVSQARRFYLDLNPPRQTDFAVVCGGWEQCQKDYQIHREDFPYFSIEFVSGGKGQLILAGRTEPLFTGRVFTYGPGIAQHITPDPNDPLAKYFIDFAGRQAEQLLSQANLIPGTIQTVSSLQVISDIFDNLIEHGLSDTRFTPALCRTLTEFLILKLAENTVYIQPTKSVAFITYQRSRQFIREHCVCLTSLSEIARACHIAPAYLCRLFRRYDHQSPYQYLIKLKMNLAAQRLQNPDTLIKQLGIELGFTDPFHFSRVFKKVFGLSPQAFRNLR
ncbi:MAG: AraC family transcriptional regulator [Sedimentisphaerales bacterium]|nr:AraC family transcriptional regulator [Sedimentisphaerales bacterium]